MNHGAMQPVQPEQQSINFFSPAPAVPLSNAFRFPDRLEIANFPPDLDTRTRNQALVDLQNRLSENPQTAIGLAGLYCCQARVEILGVSKIGLSRETGIARDTLGKLEAGSVDPNTYRRLLAVFRERVLTINESDPVQAMRLENFRTRISKLLVCESALTHPINRMMLELGYRYGLSQFEQYADFNLIALRARDKNSGTGAATRNFQAVTGLLRMALSEEGRLERNGEKIVDTLWSRPEVKQLVALEVRERMRSLSGALSQDPQGVKLAGVLLTLVSLNGPSHREELAGQYKIKSASARALTRGELIETAEAQKILQRLVQVECIPQSVADQVLTDWQALQSRRSAQANLPAVAAGIHAGLEAQQLDMAKTAQLLGIEKASRGFALRKQIDDVSIESGLFSFHALCCLAGKTLQEAESLVEDALSHARRLPKNAGREFSYPYQLAVMYGLQASDLPEALAVHVQKRFAESNTATPREITDGIMERGDRASITALTRYAALMEPRSALEVAHALDCRRANVAPHLAELGMAQTTLRKYQNEELHPGLRRVKGMVIEAGVLPSIGLVVNWYTTAAASYQSGQDAFERALPVLTQIGEGGAKSFYLELTPESGNSLSMSLREFQRLVTEYSRGNRLEKESDQVTRDANLIAVLREGGVQPELLHYLSLCREVQSAPERLERWRADMETQGKADLVRGLNELLSSVPALLKSEPEKTLEAAFINKARILSALEKNSRAHWEDIEASPAYKALVCLPGVTAEELLLAASHLVITPDSGSDTPSDSAAT